MFEKIKTWYEKHLWTKKQVHDAVDKGILTSKQYKLITGETYKK